MRGLLLLLSAAWLEKIDGARDNEQAVQQSLQLILYRSLLYHIISSVSGSGRVFEKECTRCVLF